jgi:hypothetical protein
MPFWREGGVGSGEGERNGCTGGGMFERSCWLSGDEPNTGDGLRELWIYNFPFMTYVEWTLWS